MAEDLDLRYEAMRAFMLGGGASLEAALLVGMGMAEWMRSWRACIPPLSLPITPAASGIHTELVGVLAAMALGCSGGS